MIPEKLEEYDYRENLIIDKNNPILVWKAWRDHFTNGKAHLSVPHSEDALTWNVFRSLQMAGNTGLEIISKVFGISKVNTILFWGCDVENQGDEQQLLNILIRTIDGQLQGTMTEPDLVVITECEVVFVECKLNSSGKSSPWKASDKKDEKKIDGADKRFAIYKEMFPELMCINDWRNVYQLIRQYVYARLLGCHLSKNPLVVSLVNKCHVDRLRPYYSILKDCTAVDKNIFLDFVTWQDISEEILKSNSLDYYKNRISAKINCALAHVRK
jgi:hypothetical protein